MSNIGSSKIAEMYVGSTKIAEAYLGSSLVYQLPAQGYDSYVIHITWPSSDNFNMAGLMIDNNLVTTSQVTSMYYDPSGWGWQEVSSSDVESAIDWMNNSGKSFYGVAIDINFIYDTIPTSVKVKTGTWYGGGSQTVTIHVAGIKAGVETDLGYTSDTNSNNKIYTINI